MGRLFRALGDSSESRLITIALIAVVLAGAALRLWYYFQNESLGLDELALAENVLHRPLGVLISRPLAFDQQSPPGFLALVKASVALFGRGELALRFVPVVSSLLCLPLMAVLARRVLGGWTSVLATGLFAAGADFVSYGAYVKQYSSDVAISLLLTLIVLRLKDETSPRAFVAAGFFGAIAVWFSQAAVLELAGLSVALIWIALARTGWRGFRQLVPAIGLWTFGAAAATADSLNRLTPSAHEYVRRFHSRTFPPLPPTTWEDLRLLAKPLLDFWRATGLLPSWEKLFLVLTMVGGVALWRSRRNDALVLLAPVGVTFAAAAARQYPFGGRLILFLSPAILLCAAAGVRLAVESRVFKVLLVAVVLVLGERGFEDLEQTRPIANSLAASRRPGDVVYVYYGARRAFSYYAPRAGIESAGVVLGGCHRADPRLYLREVDALRSLPRVWIFYAHFVEEFPEQDLIRDYLGKIGKRVQSFESLGAALELYDLSDPARLQTASAETFPVPEPDLKAAGWLQCAGPLKEEEAAIPETGP